MRRRQRLIEDRARGAEELPTVPAWEPVLMRPVVFGRLDGDAPLALAMAPIATLAENACPKCGRILKARGKHLHTRRCKGVTNG